MQRALKLGHEGCQDRWQGPDQVVEVGRRSPLAGAMVDHQGVNGRQMAGPLVAALRAATALSDA
ncbi:MAG: hypothetical protein WAT23_18485, partial [Chromatiaceae bacterium]